VLRGLTGSVLLHTGLLAWALVSFHTTQPLRIAEPEPVEVALVSENDIVRLRQGDRESKQLEARPQDKPNPDNQQQEANKPKPPPPPPPAPTPPPPPPPKAETPPEPPKAEAPPKEEPKKDPIAEKLAAAPPEPEGPSPEELAQKEAERKEAERKEAERKAEEKRKADAEKKRRDDLKKKEDEKKRLAELKRREDEKKKKEFDAQRIAALIDKSPEPRGAPPPSAANVAPDAKAKGPTAGAKEGTDSQLTASQRSMIGVMMRQAVSRCWNINAGAQGIEKMVVRVEVKLTREGRLDGQPKVVNSMPGPLFSDAANSALRALVQCEPYDLPENLYEGGWDHMIVTFDPQAMFR